MAGNTGRSGATGEYDLIICTYQMPDFLKETATNYPDQKFLIYDDNTYVGQPNVVNLTYRQMTWATSSAYSRHL